ncbi:MAG: hypothetical protein Q9M41_11630 [Paracoccaceae bacterium]|nr:hypothetical protein [Paracoccaceae bacterium]
MNLGKCTFLDHARHRHAIISGFVLPAFVTFLSLLSALAILTPAWARNAGNPSTPPAPAHDCVTLDQAHAKDPAVKLPKFLYPCDGNSFAQLALMYPDVYGIPGAPRDLAKPEPYYLSTRLALWYLLDAEYLFPDGNNDGSAALFLLLSKQEMRKTKPLDWENKSLILDLLLFRILTSDKKKRPTGPAFEKALEITFQQELKGRGFPVPVNPLCALYHDDPAKTMKQVVESERYRSCHLARAL